MDRNLIDSESFFEEQMKDPEFEQAYKVARSCIDQLDTFYRVLDERRCSLNQSMAELANRADLPLKVVKRFFSNKMPDRTIETLVAIATALDMKAAASPVEALQTVS